MFRPLPFTEWFDLVQKEFAKAGISLPADIELMELAHLECLEDEKSVEEYVKEVVREQEK